MEGFGPVAVKAGDAHFRDMEDWEKRMWGLTRNTLAPGITIDWFRHGIERMVPADYLSFAYFNKWCANYLMLMLDNGTITIEDVKRGHVERPYSPAAAKTLDDTLGINRKANISFEIEALTEPAYAVGQTVRTRRHIPEITPVCRAMPAMRGGLSSPFTAAMRCPTRAQRATMWADIFTRSPSRPPNSGGGERTRATLSRWTSGRPILPGLTILLPHQSGCSMSPGRRRPSR